MSGSVRDEMLGTEHAVLVRPYAEHWPRKDRAPEKVLITVVEADEQQRFLCPQCGGGAGALGFGLGFVTDSRPSSGT